MQIYKFRDCLLNTAERSVIKANEFVELTTKTFDVLQFLIENSGQIVTKDQLLGEVWNGNFVEESNLPVHVSKLRRSLGERRSSRFIETVQGVGYRFIAPVCEADSATWQYASDRIAALDMVATRQNGSRPGRTSLAVLPFKNRSGNSTLDYIAEGLTESITGKLALIPRLKVIAQSTAACYRQNDLDIQEVGETLGLSSILTGDLTLVKGEFVVRAQLVRVSDGVAVWQTQLRQPPASIIKMVGAISPAVAEFVLGDGEIRVPVSYLGTQDADSYREYLRGKYFLEKRTVASIRKAMMFFGESVEKDSCNIFAHIALIDSYRLLHALDAITYKDVLPKIQGCVDAIAGLDHNFPEAQLAFGEVKLQLEWDLEGAERHVRKALDLNPNFVPAYARYVEILTIRKMPVEAERQIHKMLELDPLSLLTYKRVGRSFYCLGRLDDALEFLMDARELEPSDYEALALTGAVLVEAERYTEALDAFNESMEINPTGDVLSMIGYTYARMGLFEATMETIARLKTGYSGETEHPLLVARIYAALGDADEAFRLLEQAFSRHEIDLYGITHDCRWRSIRDDERFAYLVERIGLSSRRLM